MAKLLTDATVRQMKPGDRRREIHDGGSKGLYLHIQPSGAKSWVMLITRPDGRTGKLWLGPAELSGRQALDRPQIGDPLTLADAHFLAADIRRQRRANKDVIGDRKVEKRRNQTVAADRAANTFGAVIREFFINYRTRKWNSRPRRWRDDAATLGLHYPPGCDPAIVEPQVIKGGLAESWGDKPVADINKFNAEAVVSEAIKHGSKSRARKLFSVLSVLFGWLPLKYRDDISPMIGMKKRLGLGPPPRRVRKLSEAEIKIFWQACDNIGGVFGALYQTLLISGCRLREPAGMGRDEFDDNGVWEVPPSRTKNHLPFMVPLSPFALKIINSVEPPKIKNEATSNSLIFTTNGKTPVSGFSKAKKALDAEMAKIALETGHPLIKPWKVHDLRRVFSTTLNESPDNGGLGIPPHLVEALLNHVSGAAKSGVAGDYNAATYLSEKRVALERWAIHIEAMVSGRPSASVTPIGKQRK
jgi:integrase